MNPLMRFLWPVVFLAACSSDDDPSQDGAVPNDTGVLDGAPSVDNSLADGSLPDSNLTPLNGPHALVVVPVANIRKSTVPAVPGDYSQDMNQETQVLWGDLLSIEKEQGEWYRVGVLTQLYFDTSKAFVPYPGWIQKKLVRKVTAHVPANLTVTAQSTKLRGTASASAAVIATLSVGTQLSGTGATDAEFVEVIRPDGGTGWVNASDVTPLTGGTPTISRAAVVARAEQFLGSKYLWGGYSAPLGDGYPGSSTGVDCSGLSGLVYRSLGVLLPRNSDDQYRQTQPIALADLQRGDLVFVSSSSNADGIFHVMLSDGGDQLIESPSSGSNVRRSTFTDKLGLTRQQLGQSGGKAGSSYVLASRVKGVSLTP